MDFLNLGEGEVGRGKMDVIQAYTLRKVGGTLICGSYRSQDGVQSLRH